MMKSTRHREYGDVARSAPLMEERIAQQWKMNFPARWTKMVRIGVQPVPEGVVLSIDISERRKPRRPCAKRSQQISLIYDTVGDCIFNLKVEKDGKLPFHFREPVLFYSHRRCRPNSGRQKSAGHHSRTVPLPGAGKIPEAIRTRKIVRWEEVSGYPTGRLFGEVSVAPVFDDSGGCVGLVGSSHDITERKQARKRSGS